MISEPQSTVTVQLCNIVEDSTSGDYTSSLQLVEFYNKVKANGSDFEIVFVSSDRDEKSFNDYYGEMPWMALPFSDRAQKQKLSAKFKVSISHHLQ